MIRPAELAAIKRGEIDLAFRGWERPRVVVGTRMRTPVGLVEVTSVEKVNVARLTADDARRAGAASVAALREALAARTERPAWRVGLTWAGEDPRVSLREAVPTAGELTQIETRLDRLDRASPVGAWTRATLDLIDRNPEVRAPDLAAQVGRETQDFKRDVRKLKDLGLTESLDIGYRLSPRGEAVVDAGLPAPRERAPRPSGTPLPHVGAPAARALRAAGLTTLEAVATRTEAEVTAMHGVGPVAVDRLREALSEAGLEWT
jgi:Helix-hairpin-helix domain